MANYGMLINTKKCIGCYACRTACQRQNDLLPDEAFIRFEEREVGTYPSVRVEHVPLQCMHCEDAPCAQVCPTGAAHMGADGIVTVDQGRCIGCLYCMAACPYSMRWCDDETGIVGKCTFCHTRTANGMDPACVNTCISSARIFGDLNDPDSEIAKRVAAGGDEVLLAELNLRPHVSYRGLEETQAMEVASAKHKGGNVYEPYEGR